MTELLTFMLCILEKRFLVSGFWFLVPILNLRPNQKLETH